jgi:hypothetical protein
MTKEEWEVRQKAYRQIPDALHSLISDEASRYADMMTDKLKKGGRAWNSKHELYYYSVYLPLTEMVVETILALVPDQSDKKEEQI